MAGSWRRQNSGQYEDSISDQACTRCRERKIRCSRELPQCTNCEREEGVECVYQSPTKRVNHLKLLFDSINGLNERLASIESSLGRLSGHVDAAKKNNNDDRSSLPSMCKGEYESEDNDEDEESGSDYFDSPMLCHNDGSDIHVFHDRKDMVDYYHGPLSLFALCNRFCADALAAANVESGTLSDMLQGLCNQAGLNEPFPSFGGHQIFSLAPKQRAQIIVGRFLQHTDGITDIFVQRNLLSQIERIYSRPTEHENDAWAICFQAIIVLVWGRDFSAEAGKGLIGDFARSFIPSRAALVSSRLLTVPRLINVQTLILLSVAAQQFDPPGWAEFLFANACALARVMGLHQAQLFPPETSTDETLERAKVLRSLYIWDKSLCTMRGSVSWLPTQDCNIALQLSAMEDSQIPYLDRLQMAMIQDEIYHVAHTTLSQGPTRPDPAKTAETLRSIERRLNRYMETFGIFKCQASEYDSRHAVSTLQFLAARIHAFQHAQKQRYREQVRSDARASCLLLLIAHGVQDPHVMGDFNALALHGPATGNQDGAWPTPETGTEFFSNVLDAFSLSAFFILIQDILSSSGNVNGSFAEQDLLRRVAACFTHRVEQMQFNNAHRKIARTLEELLKIVDLIKLSDPHQLSNLPTMSNVPPGMPLFDTQSKDGFRTASSHSGHGSCSHISTTSTANTPFSSWDLASSIELCTPFEMFNPGTNPQMLGLDMLGQVGEHGHNDSLRQSMLWLGLEQEPAVGKKRMRTQ